MTLEELRTILPETSIIWLEDFETEKCIYHDENRSFPNIFDHITTNFIYPTRFNALGGALGIVVTTNAKAYSRTIQEGNYIVHVNLDGTKEIVGEIE